MEGMNIRVNGVFIKPPTSCEIQKFKLTKSSRVANGDMKMDLIAKKIKLLLVYDAIAGAQLALIESILYADDVFFTIEYDDGVTTQTKTMYVGDIGYKKFRSGGAWYWKDLTFDLIQQ